MSNEKKKFSGRDKFLIGCSIVTAVLSLLMVVFEIVTSDNTSMIWVFSILFLSAVYSICSYFFNRVNYFASAALLIVIAAIVGAFYFYLPDVLSALASILGVSAFIYLIIEKLLEDQ